VGERLFVKETWQQTVERKRDRQWFTVPNPRQGFGELLYRATHTEEEPPRWRSSTRMPRWACRLRPTIALIRVQRLGDATEADALAEGICRVGTSELLGVPLYADSPAADPAQHYTSDGKTYDTWYAVFVATWEKTYGKKYPSAGSPWCWLLVIEHD
jgi:hypothetical protein